MLFRQANTNDLDAVCLLYRAASKSLFSVWDDDYPSPLEAKHDLETNNLYVLCSDNSVIGALSIVPESEMEDMDLWQYPNSTHREIARIAISPDHQGKGLAAYMVKCISTVLKAGGYSSIRLSAACGNLPACRTYQNLGFEIRGKADMYGSHYYLMEKLL